MLKRWVGCGFRLMVGCVLSLAWPMTLSAQDRYALIVGNAAYENVPRLENTLADAAAYARTFENMGYEVTALSDLDRSGMDFALADFLDQIRPGDTAVFVYSGHGWSDGRTNYLLPVDIEAPKSERRVKASSMPLQNGADGIIDQLRDAGAAVQVAIIDACRNNIFAGKSGTKSLGLSRGLAVERVPQGAFLVFSAGAGEESLDRLPDDNPNEQLSVFTRQFLPKLEAGLYLEDAINDAQLETAQVALRYNGHQQNPAYYDQINGKLCLGANCGAAPTSTAAATSTAVVQPQQDPCARAETLWPDIKSSDDAELVSVFAETFSECPIYAHMAASRMSELREQAAAKIVHHLPVPNLSWQSCAWGGDAVKGARICASSVLPPQSGNTYGPQNLADWNPATAWVEGVNGTGDGQKILFELPGDADVSSLVITNGYTKSAKAFANNGHVGALRISTSRGADETVALSGTSAPTRVALPGVGPVQWILLEIVRAVPGSRWQDTAISEIHLD